MRVVLAGAALDEASAREARAEEAANPRFTWLGPLRFGATQARMAAARVLAMTSRAEGGPAVVSEAIAAGLPVLATRIPGARSLLGDDYPGLFEVGDEAALAALLARCEREPEFLAALRAAVERRAEEVSPAHERACIAALLADLAHA
ncbi:MAG: glycosyltransferase [Planctomycetes bacterium]|nr:glycosyltransferase [Planctomycetota bacterium]